MEAGIFNVALELLKKDITRNINIIYFMNNYNVDSISIEGESVLIRGSSDEIWVYVSSESEAEFKKLIEGLGDDDKCFAVLEDWMLPYIVKDREVTSRLTCMKLVYDREARLPAGMVKCIPLTAVDAEYIYENSKYQAYTSTEYILERIQKGVGFGIREDDRLAAWALTHDDGAIGFLHVLDEYRGKGFGGAVTAAMIENLLEIGELPFVHIEEDNVKSMKLALKAGFRLDRRIHWFKFK